MSVQDNMFSETGKFPRKEAINDTKKVFNGMLLASKNISLYPAGHSISVKSVKQFHEKLETYLQKYGFFKLEIERNSIVSMGEEISTGPLEEGTLLFTLFRDGIRWLEFSEGIDPEEITEFLTIVHQYTILSAEPEGDIVTTIWEAQFPHIQYEVADFFVNADGEPKNTVSAFKVASNTTALRENNLDGEQDYHELEIDPASLILSPQEQEHLRDMIRFEEETDFSSYVNALLDSLLLHRDEESFGTILDVLSEEFTGTLTRGEFDVALKIVWGLRKILEKDPEQMPWAVSLSKKFFQKVSSQQALLPVVPIWSDISGQQMELLEQVLQYLDSDVIDTLAALLQKKQPEKQQQVLTDAIILHAAKDMRSLESLLKQSDEKLAESLIPVVVRLNDKQSQDCLKILLSHASPLIRLKVIRLLIQQSFMSAKELFGLIDDPDATIRHLVLRQLGKIRDHNVEELFLAYLKNTKFSKNQAGHIIECFRTLGQCGSLQSFPFLRKTLLRQKWMPGISTDAYRKGAVIALEALNLPEAGKLLNIASRSLYPGLRRVVRETSQEFQKSKGGR